MPRMFKKRASEALASPGSSLDESRGHSRPLDDPAVRLRLFLTAPPKWDLSTDLDNSWHQAVPLLSTPAPG